MSQNRGSWGSNFGFLMAAIGSAVGLGNIWGFPYKMGASGGFTFLVVYLFLSIFVGYVIMVSELAMGRRAGLGVAGSYQALTEQKGTGAKILSKFLGFLAMFAPFMIMTFYSVLGAYCIEYLVLNLSNLFSGTVNPLSGSEYFASMLTNQVSAVGFTVLFMVICLIIVKGGIKGGIEKFSNIAMPALAIMLVVVIVRSLTLPGASEGLKFMFVPGYALEAGLIDEAPSFMKILATAGGQMFFSLSLAMGAMITYGSYLSKQENLMKNSAIIVIADTCIALMAGLAVIPAAIALGGENAALGGPSLLFVTLQNVFLSMGAAGPIFGVLFYLLVLIAAITSAISLMEVLTTYIIDRSHAKGKAVSRTKVSTFVFVAILAASMVVALDGLGSNGLPKPMGFVWLDFMDLWSEGIAMPLGALLMSLLLGWCVGPDVIHKEITAGGHKFPMYTLYKFLLRFVVPVVMLLVLVGQLNDFFKLNWF